MNKIILLVFLIGTLVMMIVMSRTGAPLKTSATPNGILNLEFAYDTTRVNAIITAWSSTPGVDTIDAAKKNTYLDFIFIFFYALFLYLASMKLNEKFGGKFGKAGKWIGRGALLAGGLDVLENAGMLVSLSGHTSDPVVLFTVICAVLKWLLAVVAVLYVLTGVVALARTRLINS